MKQPLGRLESHLEWRKSLNQVSFRSIESDALVPAQWKSLADGTLSVFNMALVGLGENYLAAYRFVSGIDLKRRIATCILD